MPPITSSSPTANAPTHLRWRNSANRRNNKPSNSKTIASARGHINPNGGTHGPRFTFPGTAALGAIVVTDTDAMPLPVVIVGGFTVQVVPAAGTLHVKFTGAVNPPIGATDTSFAYSASCPGGTVTVGIPRFANKKSDFRFTDTGAELDPR
jgi:hypothetical protein